MYIEVKGATIIAPSLVLAHIATARWHVSTLIEITFNTSAINIDGGVCDAFNYCITNI